MENARKDCTKKNSNQEYKKNQLSHYFKELYGFDKKFFEDLLIEKNKAK
ncbi:hypothetical protein [Pilibacter termitis]|nr:hypothetical protein [Pilibacter termitis]